MQIDILLSLLPFSDDHLLFRLLPQPLILSLALAALFHVASARAVAVLAPSETPVPAKR